jgi:hypothetical protein
VHSGWRSLLLIKGGSVNIDSDPVFNSLGVRMDDLVHPNGAVSEVLNTAYAQHEFTDMHIDELLVWLDSSRSPSLDL